jgi:hypothetical protein
MTTTCPFTLAAERLMDRFNRRFPQVANRYDLTTIKDRWYRDLRRLVAARTRLGRVV